VVNSIFSERIREQLLLNYDSHKKYSLQGHNAVINLQSDSQLAHMEAFKGSSNAKIQKVVLTIMKYKSKKHLHEYTMKSATAMDFSHVCIIHQIVFKFLNQFGFFPTLYSQ
jgi:hypothetical protein